MNALNSGLDKAACSSLHYSLCVVFLVLTACHQSDPADRYDPSKMDLKPVPSKMSSERHSGAFSSGVALSTAPDIKPVEASAVKTVQLDTTHKIIEIAPGIKFSGWTFGDQVPGPVIRARVGDRIKFSMTNRSDEVAPG